MIYYEIVSMMKFDETQFILSKIGASCLKLLNTSYRHVKSSKIKYDLQCYLYFQFDKYKMKCINLNSYNANVNIYKNFA